jgi:hypothetical protein
MGDDPEQSPGELIMLLFGPFFPEGGKRRNRENLFASNFIWDIVPLPKMNGASVVRHHE